MHASHEGETIARRASKHEVRSSLQQARDVMVAVNALICQINSHLDALGGSKGDTRQLTADEQQLQPTAAQTLAGITSLHALHQQHTHQTPHGIEELPVSSGAASPIWSGSQLCSLHQHQSLQEQQAAAAYQPSDLAATHRCTKQRLYADTVHLSDAIATTPATTVPCNDSGATTPTGAGKQLPKPSVSTDDSDIEGQDDQAPLLLSTASEAPSQCMLVGSYSASISHHGQCEHDRIQLQQQQGALGYKQITNDLPHELSFADMYLQTEDSHQQQHHWQMASQQQCNQQEPLDSGQQHDLSWSMYTAPWAVDCQLYSQLSVHDDHLAELHPSCTLSSEQQLLNKSDNRPTGRYSPLTGPCINRAAQSFLQLQQGRWAAYDEDVHDQQQPEQDTTADYHGTSADAAAQHDSTRAMISQVDEQHVTSAYANAAAAADMAGDVCYDARSQLLLQFTQRLEAALEAAAAPEPADVEGAEAVAQPLSNAGGTVMQSVRTMAAPVAAAAAPFAGAEVKAGGMFCSSGRDGSCQQLLVAASERFQAALAAAAVAAADDTDALLDAELTKSVGQQHLRVPTMGCHAAAAAAAVSEAAGAAGGEIAPELSSLEGGLQQTGIFAPCAPGPAAVSADNCLTRLHIQPAATTVKPAVSELTTLATPAVQHAVTMSYVPAKSVTVAASANSADAVQDIVGLAHATVECEGTAFCNTYDSCVVIHQQEQHSRLAVVEVASLGQLEQKQLTQQVQPDQQGRMIQLEGLQHEHFHVDPQQQQQQQQQKQWQLSAHQVCKLPVTQQPEQQPHQESLALCMDASQELLPDIFRQLSSKLSELCHTVTCSSNTTHVHGNAVVSASAAEAVSAAVMGGATTAAACSPAGAAANHNSMFSETVGAAVDANLHCERLEVQQKQEEAERGHTATWAATLACMQVEPLAITEPPCQMIRSSSSSTEEAGTIRAAGATAAVQPDQAQSRMAVAARQLLKRRTARLSHEWPIGAAAAAAGDVEERAPTAAVTSVHGTCEEIDGLACNVSEQGLMQLSQHPAAVDVQHTPVKQQQQLEPPILCDTPQIKARVYAQQLASTQQQQQQVEHRQAWTSQRKQALDHNAGQLTAGEHDSAASSSKKQQLLKALQGRRQRQVAARLHGQLAAANRSYEEQPQQQRKLSSSSTGLLVKSSDAPVPKARLQVHIMPQKQQRSLKAVDRQHLTCSEQSETVDGMNSPDSSKTAGRYVTSSSSSRHASSGSCRLAARRGRQQCSQRRSCDSSSSSSASSSNECNVGSASTDLLVAVLNEAECFTKSSTSSIDSRARRCVALQQQQQQHAKAITVRQQTRNTSGGCDRVSLQRNTSGNVNHGTTEYSSSSSDDEEYVPSIRCVGVQNHISTGIIPSSCPSAANVTAATAVPTALVESIRASWAAGRWRNSPALLDRARKLGLAKHHTEPQQQQQRSTHCSRRLLLVPLSPATGRVRDGKLARADSSSSDHSC